MNLIIFILFWPVVGAICYGIWNEEKLIAFEQKLKAKVKGE